MLVDIEHIKDLKVCLFSYHFHSNLAVMLFKFGAYVYTGSATMLSESIHSLADLLNQVQHIDSHLCFSGTSALQTLNVLAYCLYLDTVSSLLIFLWGIPPTGIWNCSIFVNLFIIF